MHVFPFDGVTGRNSRKISSGEIYNGYFCFSVFVCCPDELLDFFLLFKNILFAPLCSHNAGCSFEVHWSRESAHYDRQSVNAKSKFHF